MNRERLRKQLEQDEGLRLKPYRDTVGKLTIGVGRNLDDKGISNAESDVLLDNDIGECWEQLNTLRWFAGLDDVRQEVLVNMCFNLGWAGLSKFRNTLGLIEAGKYAEAAEAMGQSIWAVQVGNRAQRLMYAMRNGEFQ